MGTSYTGYGRLGFWSNDNTIESWLFLLTDMVDRLPEAPPWLQAATDDWRVQATAGFMGCVDTGLDRHLAGDPSHEATFLHLIDQVGERLTPEKDATASETTSSLGEQPEQLDDVRDDLLCRFNTAVAGLVQGQVSWDTGPSAPGVWPLPR